MTRVKNLLATLQWLALASCLQAAVAPIKNTKPNIVFIFADDWGWGDLGCHGHRYVKTPNIDRLAAEGNEFRQFTVASGVCSPSRAAVLTGHFPARHSIHGHFATVESHVERGMPDWLDPDVVLLPRLLKDAGYATGHFGKWHLTNIMVPDAPLPTAYEDASVPCFRVASECRSSSDGRARSRLEELTTRHQSPPWTSCRPSVKSRERNCPAITSRTA